MMRLYQIVASLFVLESIAFCIGWVMAAWVLQGVTS